MISNKTKIRLGRRLLLAIILFLLISVTGYGQSEDKIGSWYIYNEFFNISPKVELFLKPNLETMKCSATWKLFSLGLISIIILPNRYKPVWVLSITKTGRMMLSRKIKLVQKNFGLLYKRCCFKKRGAWLCNIVTVMSFATLIVINCKECVIESRRQYQ